MREKRKDAEYKKKENEREKQVKRDKRKDAEYKKKENE